LSPQSTPEEIGNAIAEAGGGRVRVEDVINPKVGFVAAVKIGDELKPGALIGRVFCDDDAPGQTAAARIQAAYSVR
jgi:thymidine phosphorylase